MDCEFFKSGNANFKHVDNLVNKVDTTCIDVILSISNVEYVI